jgi:hypothetical protein
MLEEYPKQQPSEVLHDTLHCVRELEILASPSSALLESPYADLSLALTNARNILA